MIYIVREYVKREHESFLRTRGNFTQEADSAHEAVKITGVLGGQRLDAHLPAITPNDDEYFLGWKNDPYHFILATSQEDHSLALSKVEARIKKELAPKRAKKKAPVKSKLDKIMEQVEETKEPVEKND